MRVSSSICCHWCSSELISGEKPSAVWTGQQSITSLIQREEQPLIHTFTLAVLHRTTWADKQAQNQNCFAVSQQCSPLSHWALCHYAVQYLFSTKSHTSIYKINCQIAKTEWSTEQEALSRHHCPLVWLQVGAFLRFLLKSHWESKMCTDVALHRMNGNKALWYIVGF